MKNNDVPISIVVADDHPSVLHGVTDVLTSNPDMTVIAACSDGMAALQATASDRQLLAAVARGAKGIVLKEAALPELVQCVRCVVAGGLWLSPDVDAALERAAQRLSVSQRLIESLASREQQIVLLVLDGLSNKDVGRRFGLSEGTVKVHFHVAITCREDLQHSAYAPREEGGHPSR
jgi:two-component system nitrate/nitrite response regulator NarL